MSYNNFPQNQSVVVADSSDKLDLGGFQPKTNGELKHCVVNLYKHGILSGSGKVKLGIHLSQDFSTQFAFSNEIFLTTIEAEIDNSGVVSKDYWRAWVRFDFERINLNKNQLYYLSLQTDGYTRVNDNFFIGVVKDDSNNPIYANGASGLHSWQLPVGKSVFAFGEPT